MGWIKQYWWESKHCDISFGHNHTLQNHMQTSRHKDGTGKIVFKCELCENDYATEQNLKRHIDSVHVITTKIKCTLCDKSFKQRNFKQHIDRIHHKYAFLLGKWSKNKLFYKATLNFYTFLVRIKEIHIVFFYFHNTYWKKLLWNDFS